jgi:hypothetical protein
MQQQWETVSEKGMARESALLSGRFVYITFSTNQKTIHSKWINYLSKHTHWRKGGKHSVISLIIP